MRTRLAAVLLAALASGTPILAARAHAQAASAFPLTVLYQASAGVVADSASRPAPAFEVVPRASAGKHSNKWTWISALTGAALVGVSFPLADEADRRYDTYLSETDVARIDERFRATQRMDRLASGSLLTGEALLATAVWLRFVRGDHHERVSLDFQPSRCALALRF